jgi:hypothetical protein
MIGVKTIARGMEALKPAKFKAIASEILPVLIRHWHAHMLPRHFEPGAVQRYGYQARGEKYNTRKRRQGNPRPLVGLNYKGHHAGEAMESLRLGIGMRNKKDGKRGVMVAPKYFYQIRGAAPDKPNEATRTTEDEVKVLADMYDRMLKEAVEADKSEVSRMVT